MRPARRYSRGTLLTAAVALCLAGTAAPPAQAGATAPAGTAPQVLLVGSYQGIAGGYATVPAALAAARPGDWILVGPGDYKAAPYGGATAGSGGTPAPAGVFITTPGIHLRGMDRNTVIIDGTRPGSPACSARRADQQVSATGANGIEVYQASGVADQDRAASHGVAVALVADPGCFLHAVQCHVHDQRAEHAPNEVGNLADCHPPYQAGCRAG